MMNPAFSRFLLAAALATGAVLATTGCAVVRDQQSVGSYIDDATITTRVKAKFAEDRAVSALAIKVESLNGVVQLAGFAKTPDERVLAEQLARGTPGVKDVRNDIIVQN
ncbi:BON domain-containing protein [Hydrogenophaga bisanensis]|uniref:BON domain-containing protein n=1 Tax=Hydrogenophaga bisanensis TaxID=439611 RepID=A0ABW2R811_9BURK|nr:hyperosmotically inducible periplasmic protein [Betaproteobacteria bacterium]